MRISIYKKIYIGGYIMEKYIYLSITPSANLDLSIREDLKSFIEKYRNDIEFIEYHLSNDDKFIGDNLVEYPNDIDIP